MEFSVGTAGSIHLYIQYKYCERYSYIQVIFFSFLFPNIKRSLHIYMFGVMDGNTN